MANQNRQTPAEERKPSAYHAQGSSGRRPDTDGVSGPHSYEATLDDPLGQEECGRGYVVEPFSPPGSLLHAKLLWLHGSQDIVYIGSHNLTMSGYNDQAELTARLNSSDDSHRSALQAIHQAVTDLVAGTIHLRELWQTVSPPPPSTGLDSVLFFCSVQHSLLDQLAEALPRVSRLTVLTPFLDTSALSRLKDRFAVRDLELRIPYEGTDISVGSAMDEIPGLALMRAERGRRVHAKAYHFQEGHREWLALGSANCTQAGLIRSGRDGGNIEFLALISGGRLPDQEVNFQAVEDPSQVPATGRDWDETGSGGRGLCIREAVYRGGTLTVDWDATSSKATGLSLQLGDEVYECEGKPIELVLPALPASSTVLLTASVDGQTVTARRWLVFPEELDRSVAMRDTRRWRDYLSSSDPTRLADGVEASLAALIRPLLDPHISTGSNLGSQNRLTWKELKEAVEVFAFSPDSAPAASRSNRIISGETPLDPLSALRGLIARLQGRPPPDVEHDEESLGQYESRRGRATRNAISSLLKHLNRLAGSDLDWTATGMDRIAYCLSGTMQASALVWHKMIAAEISPELSARFVEASLNMLSALSSIETVRPAWKRDDVAGPMLLGVAAISAAADEEHDRNRLRSLAKAMLPHDPEQAFQRWGQANPGQMSLLWGDTENHSYRQSWIRDALRLLGIADGALHLRQKKWALLIRLSEADRSNDPGAAELYAQAEQEYGDHEVWLHYKTMRASGLAPRVTRVSDSVCDQCHQRLPEIKRNRLERGEAVACSCGAILLFGG